LRKTAIFICPQLVPADQIDRLLAIYQRDIIPSKTPFFRQNTNRYESNQINQFGYVEQAFLDIHDYQIFSEFSTCAKEIFCADSAPSEARL
jgi:phytanoyl-CoA hydroxylase